VFQSSGFDFPGAVLESPGAHVVEEMAQSDLFGSRDVAIVEEAHEPTEGVGQLAMVRGVDLSFLEFDHFVEPIPNVHRGIVNYSLLGAAIKAC
jgi:hypothetical protein